MSEDSGNMGRMCQAMEQLAHSQAQLANDNAGKTTAEIRQLQHETKSNYMIALGALIGAGALVWISIRGVQIMEDTSHRLNQSLNIYDQAVPQMVATMQNMDNRFANIEELMRGMGRDTAQIQQVLEGIKGDMGAMNQNMAAMTTNTGYMAGTMSVMGVDVKQMGSPMGWAGKMFPWGQMMPW